MVGGEHQEHFLVPEAGEVARLRAGVPFVLGRHSDSDLVIRKSDVSRRHVEIGWEGNPPQPILHTHGRCTLLNGQSLEPGQASPLRNGDELRLGEGYRVCYLFASSEGMRRFVLEREQQLTGQHRAGKHGPDTRAIRLAQEERASFTPREREVARLAIQGLSNGEIARELEISVSTVKLHLRNAYAKTNTQGRTELAAYLLGGDAPPWQG